MTRFDQKQLEEARFAAIGRLTKGIGHEINNPLTVLMGYVKKVEMNLATLGVHDEKITKYLEKSQDACERIEKITSGLRTFAHADDLSVDEVNLTSLYGRTLAVVRSLYFHDEIDIFFDSDGSMVLTSGPVGLVQQAFVNVLSFFRKQLLQSETKEISIDLRERGDVIQVSIHGSFGGLQNESTDWIESSSEIQLTQQLMNDLGGDYRVEASQGGCSSILSFKVLRKN